MTLFSLFLKGGILMWILLVISFIVIAIAYDRYRLLKQIRKADEKMHRALSQHDRIEHLESVIKIYKNSCPLGVMLYKILSSKVKDPALLKESLESTANLELHKLEKGMGWLSTFAAIAPLIGFLGTVIGMVRVFMNIQMQSQSGVDINILAGGIWEALITTIGGLIVGIFAIILYNDLVQNLENTAKDLQDATLDYMIKIENIRSGVQ